jgi:ribosomal protein S4
MAHCGMQAEGWDFEEDIANEDMEVEVNKEEQEEQRQQEEEALDEEHRNLDKLLKKVCLLSMPVELRVRDELMHKMPFLLCKGALARGGRNAQQVLLHVQCVLVMPVSPRACFRATG